MSLDLKTVMDLVAQIPLGKVATYGQIAAGLSMATGLTIQLGFS